MVNEAERFNWKYDYDYEDGEVREPLMHVDVGLISEKGKTSYFNCGDFDNKNSESFGFFWW